MNNDQVIEAVEVSIESAKLTISKMKELQSLTKNPHFITLILKGYFEEEASRLVLLKAEPSMQGTEEQDAINKSINAIGHFRQYLHTTIQLGRMAEKAVIDDEEMREELLREGVE